MRENNVVEVWNRDKTLRLEVYRDQMAEDPRSWSNMGVMFCSHRNYTLGDKSFRDKDGLDSALDEIKDDKWFSLPLYLYDHSGLIMRTRGFSEIDSAGWDWGMVGYIVALKSVARREYLKGDPNGVLTDDIKEKMKKALECEVKTYNSWLSGDVFGFTLFRIYKCEKCGIARDEVIDGCAGFYFPIETSGMKDHLGKRYHKLYVKLLDAI